MIEYEKVKGGFTKKCNNNLHSRRQLSYQFLKAIHYNFLLNKKNITLLLIILQLRHKLTLKLHPTNLLIIEYLLLLKLLLLLILIKLCRAF